jgi:hypothetical protein
MVAETTHALATAHRNLLPDLVALVFIIVFTQTLRICIAHGRMT